MAIFRSYNDVVLSIIEYLRLTQPELDTKPGTVARDVFVDNPAQQIAELYAQLRNISGLQSLFSVSGSELSRLASNYGLTRNSGQVATGVAVLTTNNIDTNILIPSGSLVSSNNGISFKTTQDYVLYTGSANVYRATATRLRNELDIASITDEFAIEVKVEAITSGTSGNIGPYSIISNNINGISSSTNLQTFSGGTNPESDDSFRTRVLSVFAGSNTGTSLGYLNSVNAVSGVSDSTIVVPGNPLLIRDGTQVTTNSDGETVVSEPGSGGKVDIYVLGSQLVSQAESFIYSDQSGKNNAADPSNDFIMGQRGQDYTLSISQRRVNLINNNLLPYQPVQGILTVAGSASGPNFVEKYIDSSGETKGNFELIKDTGDYSGSPFGFDKLRWISNTISLEGEEIVKGTFNGSDEVVFSEIQSLDSVTQDTLVTNENSTTLSSARSTVILNHTPVRSVSRVVNLTTGERYVVENQNPNGNSGDLNTDGNVTISGSTLPVNTDVLQVDYIWVKKFDKFYDFDNLYDININRQVQDSVDWSFGNLVKNEPSVVESDGSGGLYITVTHPVYKVVSANAFSTDISTISNGAITANIGVNTVLDIKRVSDSAELYNTEASDGILTGTGTILLPSDTVGVSGDMATIRFNEYDVFDPDGYEVGSFDSNTITLPPDSVAVGSDVLVNYIADVNILLPETNLSSMPVSRRNNKFVVSNVEFGEQPTSNIYDSFGNINANLRRAASNLRVSVKSIASGGSLGIIGQEVKRVEDAIVVVTSSSGYLVDLKPAILEDRNLTTLPSTIKLNKVQKVERINVDSLGNITSIDNVYDVLNYKILDNSYDLSNASQSDSVGSSEFELPQTLNNEAAVLVAGDILRVTFYYTDTNASELLYFSKSGEQITDKVFGSVDRIYINNGFRDPSQNITGSVRIKNYNQPSNNTSYSVDYGYTAPKENERITITYNYNQLINTITKSIENVRPITADVLIKESQEKSIDVSMRIVLLPEFATQSQTILQDANDAVSTFLTANSMGTTIDSSDLVNALYSVQGIDRVRMINFSYGSSGNVLSISAEENEYLSAGTVTIEIEER
jgi:uncharacterized phage protein gp47/JayE